MTHSIEIITCSLLSAAILWGEHYHPWRADRKMLDVRWNYVLGTLAMIGPYSFLLLMWIETPPTTNTANLIIWALAALWIDIILSGFAVWLMHEWDAKRNFRERAEVAEQAEESRRGESA